MEGDNGYSGILWNIDGEDASRDLVFDLADGGEYTLVTKTVDEITCNPLKLWHDLGEPAYPSAAETELIKTAAYPLTASSIVKAGKNVNVKIPVRKNGVVFFTLTKRNYTPDRGYDYEKVISFH